MSVHDVASGDGNNGNGGGKLEALRRKFLVDEDLIARRLEALLEKALPFSTVDRRGVVSLTPQVEGAKNRIQAALSARAIAARLDSEISEDMSIVELAEATGLAADVLSARAGELVKSRCINSSRRGMFSIRPDRIERFLDSLSV